MIMIQDGNKLYSVIGVFKDEVLAHEVSNESSISESLIISRLSSEVFVKVKVSIDTSAHVAPIAVV